jgi:predicted nucleic acid-binding protein
LTRGRPAKGRNVYDFEVPTLLVPSTVVLDTSFVVRVLHSNEPHHEACLNFMLRLTDEDCTVIYNRVLEVELAEVAFKFAVIEQHGKKAWPAKRADGRVRRRAGRLSGSLHAAWSELLSAVPHLVVELDEVATDVPKIMQQTGLASLDAVHTATAQLVGADGLVTTDAGFGAVPEKDLALYVDNSRLRSVRRRRGGR